MKVCKYNKITCYYAGKEGNTITCSRFDRFGCVHDQFIVTCKYCGKRTSEMGGTRVLNCLKCGEKTKIGRNTH
jgi:hypothetical protein